ncbi:MAG: tetratricopeptide repeat protein, partial [Myxococcota bacterium]
AEPRPQGSRAMLLGAAGLALLLALGLALYVALRGDDQGVEGEVPDELTAAGGAAEPSSTAAAEGDEESAGDGNSEEAGDDRAAADGEDEPAEAEEPPADERAADGDAAEETAAGSATEAALDVPEVPAAIERLPDRARARRAGNLRSTARRLFRRKKYDRAESLYRKAWQFHPDNGATALGLALVHKRKEAPEVALGWARKAVELNESSAEAHFALGTLLEQADDLQGAREAYETARRLNPRDKRPRTRLRRLDAK